MPWIKEFSASITNFFKGQTIGALQPIDFYHFFPLWYDLWIIRTAAVIRSLGYETKQYAEIKQLLPLPSNFRTILKKLIVAYRGRPTQADDYAVVANFFARMLQECCPDDPFALKENRIHSEPEINAIISETQWLPSDITSARKIGQLITAAGSLVHGLYNDVVTDFAWDVYGPYPIAIDGQEYTLLIRHFANLRPHELWPDELLPQTEEIKIFSLYQGINWEINFFGCHTVSTGHSPTAAMKKQAVYVGGKPIDQAAIDALIAELSTKAVEMYKKIRQMDFESLKLLVMRQECYQLKRMCDAAGIDWQPTGEMIARMKNKPLLAGLFPKEKFIEKADEVIRIFGIDKFEKEVLS